LLSPLLILAADKLFLRLASQLSFVHDCVQILCAMSVGTWECFQLVVYIIVVDILIVVAVVVGIIIIIIIIISLALFLHTGH
jgi:hypothetical protein